MHTPNAHGGPIMILLSQTVPHLDGIRWRLSLATPLLSHSLWLPSHMWRHFLTMTTTRLHRLAYCSYIIHFLALLALHCFFWDAPSPHHFGTYGLLSFLVSPSACEGSISVGVNLNVRRCQLVASGTVAFGRGTRAPKPLMRMDDSHLTGLERNSQCYMQEA